MKKALIFALVIGLIAGSMAAPATAKKKKKKKPVKVERVVEAHYTGGFPISLYGTVAGNTIGGGSFPSSGEEKYVTIEVTDSSGTAISGSVGQDPEGDSTTTEKGTFCGATEEPIEIDPGIDVTVYVTQGQCGGGPSIVTEGTIKVTFSNLP